MSGITTSCVAVSVKMEKAHLQELNDVQEVVSGTCKCMGEQQPVAQEMRKYWTPLGLNQVQHYVYGSCYSMESAVKSSMKREGD